MTQFCFFSLFSSSFFCVVVVVLSLREIGSRAIGGIFR